MPPKPRKDAQAVPKQPADPLAGLREPTESRYPGDQDSLAATGPVVELLEDADGAPFPEAVQEAFRVRMAGMVEAHGVITQEVWDEARATMVAGWHADTVSLGFLHKGGNCGCHYLAGIALTAMPAQPELDERVPTEGEANAADAPLVT